jgi:hypothetical protein
MTGATAPPEVIPRTHPDETAAQELATTVMTMAEPGRRRVPRPGVPGGLDPETRAFFEPRFGVDLGDVRVHAGSGAAQSAARLGASAYAVGTDIVMGAGQQAGRNMVTAHELAHLVRGDAAGRLCRGPGSSQGFAIISKVWRVAGRDIVLVATGQGDQVLSFYRRTGLGDKGVGVAPAADHWVPFKTLAAHPTSGNSYFVKNPYYTTVGPDDPLRGYGNTRNRDVGAWLDGQQIPPAAEAESWEQVEREMDEVAARYRGSVAGGGTGGGFGGGGTTTGAQGGELPVGETPKPRTGVAGEGTAHDVLTGAKSIPKGGRFVRGLATVAEFAGPFLDAFLMVLGYSDVAVDASAFRKLSAEKLQPILDTQLKARSSEIAKVAEETLYGVYANVRCELHYRYVSSVTGTSLGSLQLYDIRFLDMSFSAQDVNTAEWNRERGRKEGEGIQDVTVSVRVSEPRDDVLPKGASDLKDPLYFANRERDPLKQPITTDELLSWARREGLLGNDRKLSLQILHSNEFVGSDEARQKALDDLHRRIQEDKLFSGF